MLIFSIMMILSCNPLVKYRMEFVHVRTCNWLRHIFWVIELLYLPLVFSLAWTGNCKFYSVRDAVAITDCKPDDSVIWYYIMKAGMIAGFLIALSYNLILLSII